MTAGKIMAGKILDTRESNADQQPTTPLVLASASPRRRQLLGLLELPFAVMAVDVDETARADESGSQLAGRLARTKALAGSAARAGSLVVGADTVVVLGERHLGKPADADDARTMLRSLRGRPHQVITGLALALDGRLVWQSACATRVEMRPYGDAELARYVATGRPLDKAGAYAIQDPTFRPVAQIVGCYPNVVGLPLCEALRGLRVAGLTPAGPAEQRLIPPCALCDRARAIAGTAV
jgi:septum formation protein